MSKEESRHGSLHGYAVEARHNYSEPISVGKQTFTKEWKRVHFDDRSPIGVPRGDGYHEPELRAAGLYTYTAAQALRWWFHASAGTICLETRLVRYEIKYQCSWRPLTVHGHVHGEDRSNLMPDWGKGEGELVQYERTDE